MIDKTLGHYRIVEKLGAGGMGEVYRAEDTNLNRQVAIKVLAEMFSRDFARLARFEREAKLLASLNHPNIAATCGLEQADGQRFLVLELVEGETLSELIAVGADPRIRPTGGAHRGAPLPIDAVLDICRQITEGVEAAHEEGVIHRDLKPANIKITPEGTVKILDFGLAKGYQKEGATSDLSKSPTLTEEMTGPGVILGTVAYMSPEQATGKAFDKRADIWAFGCVLFECLTGRRAFDVATPFGVSWGPDNSIVFCPDLAFGLHRVPAEGGNPKILTTSDKTNNKANHRLPHGLPDGKHLLFTIMRELGIPK